MSKQQKRNGCVKSQPTEKNRYVNPRVH